jgi:hypothetical protein
MIYRHIKKGNVMEIYFNSIMNHTHAHEIKSSLGKVKLAMMAQNEKEKKLI